MKEEKHPAEVAAEGVKEVAKQGAEFVATTLKLARDVWESAKIYAIKQGLTLAQVVETALREFLKKQEEG